MTDQDLIAQGALEGPISSDERWEAGADPDHFIQTRGMARWRYVSTEFTREPALAGLQQALPASQFPQK